MDFKKVSLGALFASILLLSGCDVDEFKLPEKTEQASAEQQPATQTPQEQSNPDEATEQTEPDEPAQEEPSASIEMETSITTIDRFLS